MIVLDTHVMVWLVEGLDLLGKGARELIDANEDELRVSAISFWEMAMLTEKQRIALRSPLSRWKNTALTRSGIRTVPVDGEIAFQAGSLPGTLHGDPSDRIIIATARELACPLLTIDRAIILYGGQGHVEAIDARL